MKNLKFNYLRIVFIDGKSIEFSNALIDHIETHADTYKGFVVKLYYVILDTATKSHIEELIFKIESIESIEQGWKRVEKDD